MTGTKKENASGKGHAKSREVVALARLSNADPYMMVAGAFGIGFVLGGGLFTRLTARIAKVALRAAAVAALPHFQERLVDVVGEALKGDLFSRSTARTRKGELP